MNKENPLVSVIIPCFNHGIYLEECIKSVKEQTYQNIEIIIVNDGSTDNKTISVINNFNEAQIKIIDKENGGLSSARNAGILAAEGEYILPLDADDKIGETYVEKAVRIFSSQPEVLLVFCKGKYFGNRSDHMENAFNSYESLLLYNSIFCSCIYRKDNANNAGLYNLNMNKGMEDWDFLLRLIKENDLIIQIPEILFYYRKTGVSMWDGLNKSFLVKNEMENQIFKNNINLYIKKWGSIIEILREYEILKSNNIKVQRAIETVQHTSSYKIGSFILYPFKLMSKFLDFKK